MRDGELDGMQHFDGEIEKLIRDGAIDAETGLAYATNPGNLRLLLADLLDPEKESVSAQAVPESKDGELEIER